MTYSLRPAAAGDARFLWTMLYEASYAAENGVPDVAALREHAELARYVEGWGDRTDLGVVACDGESGDPVGAAWLRLLTGEAKGTAMWTTRRRSSPSPCFRTTAAAGSANAYCASS